MSTWRISCSAIAVCRRNTAWCMRGWRQSFFPPTRSPTTKLELFAADLGVAALRNQSGADLVALYVNDLIGSAGICGVAVSNTLFDPNGGAAWQIYDRSTCGPVSLVYAHENGHLLGMAHQPGLEFPLYPFAHGHSVAGVFTTVMYSALGPTMIPYFSNPDILYQGFPTGIADERDNARVAELNAPIVAALRPAASFVTSAPEAPTNLFTLSFGPGQIYVSWMDHSSGSSEEQEFEVERSSDGTNFTRIATTPTNQSIYIDGGLTPGDTYWYRVRAVNFIAPFGTAGVSAYSNVAPGTVGTPPAAPSALQAQGVSTTAIQLSWTDNSTDELAFAIEMFVNGAFEPYDEAPANATSYTTVPGFNLQPGTTYSFRVYAYNDFGASAIAGPVQGTTLSAPPDFDGDGSADGADNCGLVPNGPLIPDAGGHSQLDADGDGYGNACDADLNNSGTVTTADFGLLRSVLGQAAGFSATAAAADMNGSGTVTTADFGLLRARLGTAPGPSGLSCAGTIPCPGP